MKVNKFITKSVDILKTVCYYTFDTKRDKGSLTDGVEYIVAARHLQRCEVACTFRYGWFGHRVYDVFNFLVS